jgi:uncharacterized protein (DUF2336 family)
MAAYIGRAADPAERTVVCEASARKLAQKLGSSGRLGASYLIRVLRQGQMELFDHGFATLLQLDVEPVRRALYGDNPHTLALACRAAGIDRSAFATVLQLCRHDEAPGGPLTDRDRDEIHAIFSHMPKGAARERFRAAAA